MWNVLRQAQGSTNHFRFHLLEWREIHTRVDWLFNCTHCDTTHDSDSPTSSQLKLHFHFATRPTKYRNTLVTGAKLLFTVPSPLLQQITINFLSECRRDRKYVLWTGVRWCRFDVLPWTASTCDWYHFSIVVLIDLPVWPKLVKLKVNIRRIVTRRPPARRLLQDDTSASAALCSRTATQTTRGNFNMRGECCKMVPLHAYNTFGPEMDRQFENH